MKRRKFIKTAAAITGGAAAIAASHVSPNPRSPRNALK